MPWEAVKSRTLGARSSLRWSKVIGPAVTEARRPKRTAVAVVVKRIFGLVMLKMSWFLKVKAVRLEECLRGNQEKVADCW